MVWSWIKNYEHKLTKVSTISSNSHERFAMILNIIDLHKTVDSDNMHKTLGARPSKKLLKSQSCLVDWPFPHTLIINKCHLDTTRHLLRIPNFKENAKSRQYVTFLSPILPKLKRRLLRSNFRKSYMRDFLRSVRYYENGAGAVFSERWKPHIFPRGLKAKVL